MTRRSKKQIATDEIPVVEPHDRLKLLGVLDRHGYRAFATLINSYLIPTWEAMSYEERVRAMEEYDAQKAVRR